MLGKLFPIHRLLGNIHENIELSLNESDLDFKQNIKVSIAFIKLIFILFNHKDFSENITENSAIFARVVQMEVKRLNSQSLLCFDFYKFYLIDNFLPLFNFLSNHLIKDIMYSDEIGDVLIFSKLAEFAENLSASLQ